MRPATIALAILLVLAALAACGDRAAERAEADRRRASEEAARVKDRADAGAAREVARLEALWTYSDTAAGKGRQLAASILSTNDVDTGGTSGRVQLVFRDHPSWGRSSYLVLRAGDFNCYGGCTVVVTGDGAEPRKMAARRPRTDEAIAMFIDDVRTLWKLTVRAKRIQIEFPVRAGGTRTAVFDVSGLDSAKMPALNEASATKPVPE